MCGGGGDGDNYSGVCGLWCLWWVGLGERGVGWVRGGNNGPILYLDYNSCRKGTVLVY